MCSSASSGSAHLWSVQGLFGQRSRLWSVQSARAAVVRSVSARGCGPFSQRAQLCSVQSAHAAVVRSVSARGCGPFSQCTRLWSVQSAHAAVVRSARPVSFNFLTLAPFYITWQLILSVILCEK